MGLQILNREKQVYLANPNMQPELDNHQFLVGKQLKPEARKDIITYLKEREILPTSMIDVSDGLSSELLHICKQSNVGCLLYEANVPIQNDTYNQALEFNIDPITCALSGGEDYELLFTVNAEDEPKINTDEIDIAIIGKIVEITNEKTKEMPVIIMLSSIEECELIKDKFEKCFIFGQGRVP